MKVRQLDDAAAFLAATHDLRAAQPVLTNIHGTIAQSVAAGRRYERELWFVVEDDAGVVVGAALWTLPHKLLVTPMSDDAASALGRAAGRLDVRVHGVIGPARQARLVAAAVGGEATPYMDERVLVLGDYLAPPPVAGGVRRASTDDLDLLVEWLDRFGRDAGLAVMDGRASARANLDRTWLWVVEGEPVALAGHAPVVAAPGSTVARVGPVYTPAPLRGRGYGSAVTAAVVEHLLPRVDTVMLYTDAANPTSNAIYERLGFAHVADVVDLDLAAP